MVKPQKKFIKFFLKKILKNSSELFVISSKIVSKKGGEKWP
jgi:hypothetical protein